MQVVDCELECRWRWAEAAREVRWVGRRSDVEDRGEDGYWFDGRAARLR